MLAILPGVMPSLAHAQRLALVRRHNVTMIAWGCRPKIRAHAGDARRHHRCMDEQCGDILVSDRLRKVFLDEASEEWDLFSQTERQELIFHVLRRLAIGGGMNQYDDDMSLYLNLTKTLYKDLVTVQKSSAVSFCSHPPELIARGLHHLPASEDESWYYLP